MRDDTQVHDELADDLFDAMTAAVEGLEQQGLSKAEALDHTLELMSAFVGAVRAASQARRGALSRN